MRAAAVAHVLRQSEYRAVAAAALAAAGNAAVERLSPEAYAALSAAVALEEGEGVEEGGDGEDLGAEGGEGGAGRGDAARGGQGGGQGGQTPACQRIVAMLHRLEKGGLCAHVRDGVAIGALLAFEATQT